MAIHVTCGIGGAYSERGSVLPVEQAALAWSKTLTSPGMTTPAVPANAGYSYSTAILTIVALGEPGWIAIGQPPNPSADPRRYIPIGQIIYVAAQPGDVVAYAAVS